jgi:hypothetical protein
VIWVSILLFLRFLFWNCSFLGTPEVIVNQTVIYGNQSNAITLFCEVKGVPNVTSVFWVKEVERSCNCVIWVSILLFLRFLFWMSELLTMIFFFYILESITFGPQFFHINPFCVVFPILHVALNCPLVIHRKLLYLGDTLSDIVILLFFFIF